MPSPFAGGSSFPLPLRVDQRLVGPPVKVEPDQDQHRRHQQQQAERQPDAAEVGETVAAGSVDHQVGLIADGCQKARRGDQRDHHHEWPRIDAETGNKVITFDRNGETIEFSSVLCTLEPQMAAGSEILFTAVSYGDPGLDITQFGDDPTSAAQPA